MARFCAVCVALVAGPAIAAQHLSFDQARFYGDGITIGPGDSPLLIDGWSLIAEGRPGLDVFAIDNVLGKVGDTVPGVVAGTPRLFANNGATVLLTGAAGNAFDLLSVDYGGSYYDQWFRWADGIEVKGYRSNAGSVVATTTLGLHRAASEPSLATHSFGPQFRNLSRVSFQGIGDIGTGRNNREFVLDNLVVSQVPEPESYALLLSGLGLLITWRCRRGALPHASPVGAVYPRTQSTQ